MYGKVNGKEFKSVSGFFRLVRMIKKMSQIVIKFVSILSSPPKVGAKKFLGNLGAVKALLGTVRTKKASTATTKSTILNVVSLLVLTSGTAKTKMETAGMEVTIRLEMTQHNIVRILSQEVAKSSM